MRRFSFIVFLMIAVVTATFLLFGGRFDLIAQDLLGGPRSFTLAIIIMLLLCGDILLPVPASLLIAGAGAAFGPFLGGLVAAVGTSIGSCGGFLLARKFGAGFTRHVTGDQEFERVTRMLRAHGPILLLVLRPVPVLAETSVVAAGAGGAPRGRCLVALLLGSTSMSFGYAILGASALQGGAFLAAAGLSIVLPAAALIAWQNAAVLAACVKRIFGLR